MLASGRTSSIEWKFQAEDALDALRLRAAVRAFFLAEAAEGSDVDAAVLIFGELVGNVIRHAPGEIVVAVRWDEEGPVLRVEDRGPGLDRVPAGSLDDPWRESGRGFGIVNVLADDIRVEPRADGGTRISVRLALERGR